LEECPLEEIAARVEAGKKSITDAGGRIDYFEIVDTETLEAPTAETTEILAAAAVYYGSTRLIDNTIVRFK
jgi:pantoate--beta-alanine ligase